MPDRAELDAELGAGLALLGVPADDAVRGRLLDYVDLLARWNATYNLTAVREPQAMVSRHLLDSLAIAPFIDSDAVADLGTGPGLPGIPLAIARPGLRVVLVEANGKKARFLREVVRRLDLATVEVVEARAEGRHPAVRLTRVVARALAALPELVRLADPWLAEGGRLLAMKGPGHEDERRGLSAGWQVEATHGITVPGLDAGRFLVVLKRAGDP